jgi:hypothetical protein
MRSKEMTRDKKERDERRYEETGKDKKESAGARERGSEGARQEVESDGTRERGSEGARGEGEQQKGGREPPPC